jgi:hypothetical protein
LQALLGGCSAGGLSSILHCDKFKAALPGAKVVKCMSDAGFFVNMSVSVSVLSVSFSLSVCVCVGKLLLLTVPLPSIRYPTTFSYHCSIVGPNPGIFLTK